MQLSTDWKRSSTLTVSKTYTSKENKWNKPTKITYNKFFCTVKVRQKNKKKYKDNKLGNTNGEILHLIQNKNKEWM